MATTIDFIKYVCEQISGVGFVRYKKMFGEYMVYVNDKPVLLVCDNTVYVKMLDRIADKMGNAETGFPYKGAKEHYILDIDDADFSKKVIRILESVTPLQNQRKRISGFMISTRIIATKRYSSIGHHSVRRPKAG